MKRGRKYFHFQKPVQRVVDTETSNDGEESRKHQNETWSTLAETSAADDEQRPQKETYPHVKRPPRAENRTQPGKQKTVYAELIKIREQIAASAKIPKSNLPDYVIDVQDEPKWTKSMRLKVISNSEDLRREMRQPILVPLMIPAHSPLGQEWIDRSQYPRTWAEIFPFLTKGKINVQPYEKDEDKVATDAIRLTHLEDAIFKERADRGRPYNCLDLKDQIGIHIFPSEVDEVNLTSVSALAEVSGQNRITGADAGDLTFNILSMRDSFTPPHVDAGGYLTFVHMLKGKKVWYLQEKSLPEMDEKAHELMSEGGIPLLTERMDLEWSRVLLAKGDSIILPAGLPHCVDTITDTFAVGGHFVAQNSLHLCLSSFATTSTIEHITNEEAKALVLEVVMSSDLEQYPEKEQLYNAVSQIPPKTNGPIWANFQRKKTEVLAHLEGLMSREMQT